MEPQQTSAFGALCRGGRAFLAQGDPGLSLSEGDAHAPGTTSADCVQSLQRIEGLLAGRMNNRFRPYGLSTATFNVILVLSRAGGSLSPCDIGEQLSVTRGTVTGLLDSLERQRLVRRTPHPKDRRMLLIELTNEGRNILDRLMPSTSRACASSLPAFRSRRRRLRRRPGQDPGPPPRLGHPNSRAALNRR